MVWEHVWSWPRVGGVQGHGASLPPPGAAEVERLALADGPAAPADLTPAQGLPQGTELPLEALRQLRGAGHRRHTAVLLHWRDRHHKGDTWDHKAVDFLGFYFYSYIKGI